MRRAQRIGLHGEQPFALIGHEDPAPRIFQPAEYLLERRDIFNLAKIGRDNGGIALLRRDIFQRGVAQRVSRLQHDAQAGKFDGIICNNMDKHNRAFCSIGFYGTTGTSRSQR